MDKQFIWWDDVKNELNKQETSVMLFGDYLILIATDKKYWKGASLTLLFIMSFVGGGGVGAYIYGKAGR